MAEANWLKRAGMTPAKGIAVGVLALVLIIVCVMQFGGTTPQPRNRPRQDEVARQPQANAPRANAPRANAPSRPVSTPPRTPAIGTGDPAIAKPWPEVDVDTVVQFDPLQLPRRVAVKIRQEDEKRKREAEQAKILNSQQAEEEARRVRMLAELRKTGVELIVSTGGHVVALVGSRPVQVGDTINGLTVSEIRPDGIILTEQKLP